MRECPVCRAAIIGRPPTCQECNTPLGRARWSRSSSARVLTLLCPGLGHLWLGYLYLGSLVTFVSLLLAGLFLSPVGMPGPWRRVLAWLLVWIPWASLWSFHLWERRRRRASARGVVRLVVFLLVLANGGMLSLLLVGWSLGRWV